MSDFRQLAERFWVSPQLEPDDIGIAARQGFTLIVNNRPDGESQDQVSGEILGEMAAAAGLQWLNIPVTHTGFAEAQLLALRNAIDGSEGAVLAYCRSGTRSAFLWALTEARSGSDIEALKGAAAAAGYDLTSILPLLERVSGAKP